MDIQYKGANCIEISHKNGKLLIDNNLKAVGSKNPSEAKVSAVLQTMDGLSAKPKDSLIISGPGEYEVAGFMIKGIAARGHMDADGAKSVTMYKIDTVDASVLITGHTHPDVKESTLEKVGMTDIMIVPVGGNGYTLDAEGATKLVKKIEPKVVIPTHYKQSGIDYEVPQNDLKEFIEKLATPAEKQDNFKVKGRMLSETLQVVELNIK